MSDTVNRVTVKLKSPNPLFEKWLIEWRDKAKEKASKMEHTFNIALNNLKKYPIPMESGRDCLILKGFGPKLCEMLDKKLNEYKKDQLDATVLIEEPLVQEPKRQKLKKKTTENVPQQTAIKITTPKRTPNKVYTPAYRSGPYAILIALLNLSQKPNYSGSSTKEEIINEARAFCDKSFTKPDPGSFYTAWSSMTNLISKNFIQKKGRPFKYCLTPEGTELATRLISSQENDNLNVIFGHADNDEMETENNSQRVLINKTQIMQSDHSTNTQTKNVLETVNNFEIRTESSSTKTCTDTVTCKNSHTDIISSQIKKCTKITSTIVKSIQNSQETTSANCSQNTQKSGSSQASNFEQIIFTPSSFDIILLVDTQETEGSNKSPLDDDTKYELNRLGIAYEIRHMKVGDFTWICKERESQNELVLPYVAERKRMDDLGHSIRDGRFHEQKFRLKQSGIQNLIYIIESFGSNTHTGLPLSSLMQGATNTLIQDGFQVKFTDSHRHSMQYVAGFSLILKKYYENKTLMSCPKDELQKHTISDDLIALLTFKDFNKGGSKNKDHTVKEIFVKQLVQLKGMSVEKALAVVEKYPTPRLLIQEYEKLGNEGENLLTKIEFGPLKKTVGTVISKSIYQLYTSDKLT